MSTLNFIKIFLLSAIFCASGVTFAGTSARGVESSDERWERQNRELAQHEVRMQAASEKQFLLDIAKLKKGDRGSIVRRGILSDGPLTSGEERYLSMSTTEAEGRLLYCTVDQPTELEVVGMTNEDVIVSLSSRKGSLCDYVLMPKEYFVKYKNAYLARNTKREEDSAARNAEMTRLRSAQAVWSRPH